MPRLAAMDVNLLVALDLLLQERSVTRAAARMAVTQPAMSQTLRRLRAQLDDPLLVRAGGRMVPTPRAEALAGPLRQALDGLQAVVAAAPRFDPATAQRRFTVATTDYGGALWVPALAAALAAEAPGVDLRVQALDAHVPEALERGEADLAVGVMPDGVPGLQRARLYDEGFRALVRAGHPLLDAPDRLDAYCGAQHVLVGLSGRGQGAVDRALARLGRQRRVAVRVPYFLAAPLVVAGSDLVLTAPARAVALFERHYPLIGFAPPVTLAPFSMSMAWHARYERDPGSRWLRDRLAALVAAG